MSVWSVLLAGAVLAAGPGNALEVGEPRVLLNGAAAPGPSTAMCGLALVAGESGPQAALLGRDAVAACLNKDEEVCIEIPVASSEAGAALQAEAVLIEGGGADVALSLGAASTSQPVGVDKPVVLTLTVAEPLKDAVLRCSMRGSTDGCLLRLRQVRPVNAGAASGPCLHIAPAPPVEATIPPPVLPGPRPGLERALIEWDWRMRDGIETEREPVAYSVAIERLLKRGRDLMADLAATGVDLSGICDSWQGLEGRYTALLSEAPAADAWPWEALWRDVHRTLRRIVFLNPLMQTGPVLFAKHVPSSFSHQLTQYYGRCARAGGGLFVLEKPGESMACRALVSDQLPPGSFMHPEPGYDGTRVLFAFCESPSVPNWDRVDLYRDRHYHLFDIQADGSGLRQLTDGPYDDFSPRELPNGKIVFVSTRRGGFHRCGRGPCDVYTLAAAEADGSGPHPISFHETNEWDPSVLDDGRLVYTRWDYVDRNAVHYQQLWSTRPDGSNTAAFYGNNTWNPVGVWEARQVPDSTLVMATAAAHHAMTAGSIILVDRSHGVDGLSPLRRLTPDALFPESETLVPPQKWRAPGSPKEVTVTEEQTRWPGHCYKSPYPLSEKYFIVSYSFAELLGEPAADTPNMFGLYAADAFGNRELLYRDLNISSLWPVPLRARPRPPVLPSVHDDTLGDEGLLYLQDVYAGKYGIPKGSIKRLRIVQVLPKTTWNANDPMVGLAFASPGKQVLGTVPVEADGSAFFRVPARIPLCFQALDEQGRAVQTMRSLTYVQPGEKTSCVGCHEQRLRAPATTAASIAARRPPSPLTPAPDGSNPFSYPLLVQPVLDKYCVRCHSGDKPAGPADHPVVLTGERDGHYTKSYNELAPRVPFSAWGVYAGADVGDGFGNGEPETMPNRFGAKASRLMDMLLQGHHDVAPAPEDIERLVTWMDANALFYGTFDPQGQAQQADGQRIAGPALN